MKKQWKFTEKHKCRDIRDLTPLEWKDSVL